MTRKYRIGKNITALLIVLLNIGPLLATLIYSLCTGVIQEHNKITLGIVFVFVLVLTITNLLAKWHLRTPLWVFLFALYWLLDQFLVVFLIIGICTIVDEIIVTPLHRYFKNNFKVNKAIDKRIEQEKRNKYILDKGNTYGNNEGQNTRED